MFDDCYVGYRVYEKCIKTIIMFHVCLIQTNVANLMKMELFVIIVLSINGLNDDMNYWLMIQI